MKINTLVYLLFSAILLNFHSYVHGATDTLNQVDSASAGQKINGVPSADVAPFGTTVFTIYTGIGPFSPAQRARLAEQKIKSLADNPFFVQDSIAVFRSDFGFAVMYGESLITSVFEEDAKAEGSTREAVAKSRQAKIIYAIREHRKAVDFGEILKNSGFSFALLVFCLILINLTKRLFKRLAIKMPKWQQGIMKLLHLKEIEFFNQDRQLAVLLVLLKLLRWIITLMLLMATLLAVFYLLPWTKQFTIGILSFIVTPFKNILHNFWAFIPNLITILVILIFTRLIIRLVKFFKREVEKETLKIPGFYADWALPTFNILRVLIILFTIIAIWPYLPGSGSQVFQGVSVLFGIVFSLTSASSLANFMAGLTLTYTRAFKLGDRVKIGEVTGDIIEKSMLVTKIRTIKNEEITVPNTKIMNSEVINYSTCAPDLGLIMHTTVTIGYDAPWRQVHQLLVDAAGNTEHILKDPKPFVLQTALNDFYISYQLNAFTRKPNDMAVIFSMLHQNIQDSFNNAGVEIMSPHYKSIRDGNTIAIPEEYREKDYETPSFNIGR